MRFYLDTADLSDIKEAYEYGLFKGVTTNPSILKKSQTDDQNFFEDVIDLDYEELFFK